MDQLLDKLEQEIAARFNPITAMNFKSFARNNSLILSKLEKDFNSGLDHCLEILEYIKGIKV